MKNVQIINVAPSIPAPLRFLETLARNAWWSWSQEAQHLFRRIDPVVWKSSNENPLQFLREVPQATLESLSHDLGLLSQLARLEETFAECTARDPNPKHGLVAYFSLEFGLNENIRLYSGGLGILAGDHLKAASDLALPLVAVGLFYFQGYFEQRLNHEGWQQEVYPDSEIQNLPIKRARNTAGELVTVTVQLPEGELFARVWVLKVGSVPLYLLDTNESRNPPEFREITSRLYGGGHVNRLRQELLLAVGGFRALVAMELEPEVCHLNEGHAAFLSLARLEYLTKTKGLDLNTAYEVASRANVFTTHTPVAAGNETFAVDLVEAHLKALQPSTGIDPWWFIPYGRAPGDTEAPLSMTILGLRFAHFANGVSALHGDVARRMWQHVWPHQVRDELPVRHVTNGVHATTWLAPEIQALLEQYVGADWEKRVSDPAQLARVLEIPDEEIWRAHDTAHSRLLRSARASMEKQLLQRNASRAELSYARGILDPEVLTIGFARRAASYKRATLLLSDPDRLEALINHSQRPVQFIYAGKAHPADNHGKDFIRQVVEFSKRPGVRRRFFFLENYDMRIARYLVQGVDVWLNTPRRRVEASGTSGMKAAMNGVINASILDGWWCEGYKPECGFAIGHGEEYEDDEYADQVESAALYKLLEDDIAPLYYDRPGGGDPIRWIAMMKESIKMAVGFFTSRRMVGEYRDSFYTPASANYRELMASSAKTALAITAQRQRLDSLWSMVRVEGPQGDRELSQLHSGDSFHVTCPVFLGGMKPEEVAVQFCFGPADAQSRISAPAFREMKPEPGIRDGWMQYSLTVSCPGSGRFGMTTRAVPAGGQWHSVSPPYITWADSHL
ncbi:MAG: alpha-glucan family phosphorylase [Verrucomicrobiaceae bacterium]|nr:MAG: alpha-glucan family phosphorylase [Verrucomicrobiaceae bacterium]